MGVKLHKHNTQWTHRQRKCIHIAKERRTRKQKENNWLWMQIWTNNTIIKMWNSYVCNLMEALQTLGRVFFVVG